MISAFYQKIHHRHLTQLSLIFCTRFPHPPQTTQPRRILANFMHTFFYPCLVSLVHAVHIRMRQSLTDSLMQCSSEISICIAWAVQSLDILLSGHIYISAVSSVQALLRRRHRWIGVGITNMLRREELYSFAKISSTSHAPVQY